MDLFIVLFYLRIESIQQISKEKAHLSYLLWMCVFLQKNIVDDSVPFSDWDSTNHC